MRILLWSELFWPYVGGAEILLARLAIALDARGHQLLVVTSHDNLDLPDEAEHEGLPIQRLPFRRIIGGRELGRFREVHHRVADLKRTFAPDVIHVNGIGPSVFFHLHTRQAWPAPALVTLQSEVLASQTGRQDTVLFHSLMSADWVVGCSETVLAQARALAPQVVPRSSAIRNRVAAMPAEATPLPAEPPRLLCLGRLVPAKGFDVALTAMAMLAGRFPSLRLDIAGDGEQRRALERQAHDLGLDGMVRFLGWVRPADIPELLRTASIVLMPSRREGLPLAAVEAALHARPIVASAVGGLPEIVRHQKTGLLVEPDDPLALADAVAAMIGHPHDARRMGEAAFRHARASFDWDECVEAYDALYHALAGGVHVVGQRSLDPQHR